MGEKRERKREHRIWRWAGILFLLVIAAGVGAAAYYMYLARRTLDAVTEPDKEQTVFSVCVAAEDAAQKLGDTKEYTFGISINAADEITNIQVKTRLEQLLKTEPGIQAYENPFELMDALKKEEVGAVILNEAYLAGIAGAEGYEWTENGVRSIASFVWEAEREEEEKESQAEAAKEKLPEKFIVYISGIDTYGAVSTRSRSDVNILAVVNTDSRKILMVATPRDFYVDFAATNGSKDKLTHAGIYGVSQSVDALERLYDIDIDYYLRMNFTGFVDLIDALGGVEVYSEYDFTVQNIRSYQKGWNRLSGIEALAFARERYSFASGDYQRAANQMEVIRAVIKKAASPALLKNFQATLAAVSNSFETDMPQKHLKELLKIQLSGQLQWEVEAFTTQGTSGSAQTYSMPGQNLYVIYPDEASVEEAKKKIEEI